VGKRREVVYKNFNGWKMKKLIENLQKYTFIYTGITGGYCSEAT